MEDYTWMKDTWMKNPWMKDPWMKENWMKDSRLNESWMKDSRLKESWMKDSWMKDQWNNPLGKLALLMAKNNKTVAMHDMRKEKKMYKYHMALELAENNVIIAKQILDLNTTAKARNLGMTTTAYLQQKQRYKKEKEALLKKLHRQDKQFEIERKRLFSKHDNIKHPNIKHHNIKYNNIKYNNIKYNNIKYNKTGGKLSKKNTNSQNKY